MLVGGWRSGCWTGTNCCWVGAGSIACAVRGGDVVCVLVVVIVCRGALLGWNLTWWEAGIAGAVGGEAGRGGAITSDGNNVESVD